MADTASQLKIRVRLQEEADAVKTPNEIVEYRWDRIITVLILTTLIISSAVGLAFYLLQNPEKTQPLYQVSPVTLVTEEITATEESSTKAEQSEQALSAEPSISEKPPKEAMIVKPVAEISDRRQEGSEADLPRIISGSPALMIVRAPEHIAEARISTGINNREPVDSAPALIAMNRAGLIRLFMFTELNNLKGERIHHDWYRNDQREARITMNPQLERLKAHSSKYIDIHLLGDWRVEVVRDSGEVLAETAFEVR